MIDLARRTSQVKKNHVVVDPTSVTKLMRTYDYEHGQDSSVASGVAIDEEIPQVNIVVDGQRERDMHDLFHGAAVRGSVYERIRKREQVEQSGTVVKENSVSNRVAPLAREIVLPVNAQCSLCANLAVSHCDYQLGGF